MRDRQYTTNDLSNFMSSYNEYSELQSYLPQLDRGNEKIKEVCGEQYYKSRIANEWFDIDLHIVPQLWNSTACGWGGIGGQAFTTSYNFIIHQRVTNWLYVYWNGKLAYIIEKDEIKDFGHLPYIQQARAIYKNNR